MFPFSSTMAPVASAVSADSPLTGGYFSRSSSWLASRSTPSPMARLIASHASRIPIVFSVGELCEAVLAIAPGVACAFGVFLVAAWAADECHGGFGVFCGGSAPGFTTSR